MVLASPKKASKYFRAKMEFTTGPVELNGMIQQQEEINIIDVRKPEDFRQGHIPGAINKYRQLDESFTGLSKDRNNIIYCYSEDCHLAASAAREFAEHGYPVIELEGGFESWKTHNLPIEVQPWTKPETEFTSTEEMQEQEEPEEEQSSWPEEQEEE